MLKIENLHAEIDGKIILPCKGRGTMRSMVEGYQPLHALGGSGFPQALTPLRHALRARHLPSKGRI